MSRGPDAATLIERALIAGAAAAGCQVRISGSDATRWASATFVGAQHLITLAACMSPQFDAWVSALPEADFALRGHLVADLTVTRLIRDRDMVTAHLEILTVEER